VSKTPFASSVCSRRTRLSVVLKIRVSMRSIPSLATTSNSMIRNGFRVSPADHPWPSMADVRTIGKWMGGAMTSRRVGLPLPNLDL
jgi:hypothetical protein